MNKIVKMKFGSHLYGLNTENSDTDYKGIYLPDKNECFLNKIPKSINKSAKEYKRKKLKMVIKALKKEYRERCKIELININ